MVEQVCISQSRAIAKERRGDRGKNQDCQQNEKREDMEKKTKASTERENRGKEI